MYRVEFTSVALNELKKLDPQIGRMIIAWVSKHLDQCDNPRLFGKGLSDDKKGLWSYRIGDYRLRFHLMDDRLIILVVDVGRRKDSYK